MANFEPAFEHVMEYEGGYVNDPDDPGGETKYGISKRSYPNVDIKSLSKDSAMAIYEIYWWAPLRCDDIDSQAIATKLFSLAVNMGKSKAVRLLQSAVNSVGDPILAVDGKIGPLSVAAINALVHTGKEDALLQRYIANAIDYYKQLGKPKYLRGWIRRAMAR